MYIYISLLLKESLVSPVSMFFSFLHNLKIPVALYISLSVNENALNSSECVELFLIEPILFASVNIQGCWRSSFKVIRFNGFCTRIPKDYNNLYFLQSFVLQLIYVSIDLECNPLHILLSFYYGIQKVLC